MAQSTCTACDRGFTGVGPFDEHQQWNGDYTHTSLVCLDPADLGMETNDRGFWGRPGGNVTQVFDKGYVPASERPAHEFDRTCTECGTIFQRPRRRGRPPTKCPTCRGV